MRIEPVQYRKWKEAFRCTAGDLELIIVTEIGPRILSLSRNGGPNVLYEDHTDFRVGGWRLYGGHRFTVGPESGDSYLADNQRCVTEMRDEELRVSAAPDRNGLARLLVISSATPGRGFILQHILVNRGSKSWQGALWAITCVPPAKVLAPRPGSQIRFWPGTMKEHWDLGSDYLEWIPRSGRGKIGWYQREAWLAALQVSGTLVIHNSNPPIRERCIDEGCNLEVFACADYLELETLGGELTLLPGCAAKLMQHWQLLEPSVDPYSWNPISTEAECGTPLFFAHAL